MLVFLETVDMHLLEFFAVRCKPISLSSLLTRTKYSTKDVIDGIGNIWRRFDNSTKLSRGQYKDDEI